MSTRLSSFENVSLLKAAASVVSTRAPSAMEISLSSPIAARSWVIKVMRLASSEAEGNSNLRYQQ